MCCRIVKAEKCYSQIRFSTFDRSYFSQSDQSDCSKTAVLYNRVMTVVRLQYCTTEVWIVDNNKKSRTVSVQNVRFSAVKTKIDPQIVFKCISLCCRTKGKRSIFRSQKQSFNILQFSLTKKEINYYAKKIQKCKALAKIIFICSTRLIRIIFLFFQCFKSKKSGQKYGFNTKYLHYSQK